MQAFGFLGMFCNVIGIVLLQISFRPIEATMAASGFASECRARARARTHTGSTLPLPSSGDVDVTAFNFVIRNL